MRRERLHTPGVILILLLNSRLSDKLHPTSYNINHKRERTCRNKHTLSHQIKCYKINNDYSGHLTLDIAFYD